MQYFYSSNLIIIQYNIYTYYLYIIYIIYIYTYIYIYIYIQHTYNNARSPTCIQNQTILQVCFRMKHDTILNTENITPFDLCTSCYSCCMACDTCNIVQLQLIWTDIILLYIIYISYIYLYIMYIYIYAYIYIYICIYMYMYVYIQRRIQNKTVKQKQFFAKRSILGV